MRKFKSIVRLKKASKDEVIQLIGVDKTERINRYFNKLLLE